MLQEVKITEKRGFWGKIMAVQKCLWGDDDVGGVGRCLKRGRKLL